MAPDPKYRLMVVDDDSDVRLTIEEALQDAYEVVSAHDGLDALEKIVKYEPDFIILDMVMPLMDGLQTCAAIRRKPGFESVQILFLSAYDSRKEIQKTYAAGGSLFIPKPVNPERLRKNIDLFLNQAAGPPRHKRMSLHQIHQVERTEKRIVMPEKPAATPSHHPAPGAQVSESKPRQPALAHRPAKTENRQPVDRGPRVTAPRPQPHTSCPPADKSSLVARALVIEDDLDLAQTVKMALEDHFEVVLAYDGIEGVEKVVRYQPDIVLVDIMLPKMDGYQICESIRRNSYFATTPIVVMTAKKTARERGYARKVGADVFLGKPFEIEDLVKACVEQTRKPTFRIRPKAMSLQEPEKKPPEPEPAHDPFSREAKFDRISTPRGG
ncbi:response regulator [bacterium]|nr:response regulator [bacterium]